MSDNLRSNCEICQGDLIPVNFAKRYVSLSECVAFNVTDKDYGVCLPMVKCARCGLIQTEEMVTVGEVLKLYDTDDREYLKTAEARGRSNYLQVKKILGERIRSVKSVFEIGAGSGSMLKCFKDDDRIEVGGLETNAFFCDFSESSFNIKLQNTSVEHMVTDKQYDLIVAIDVIEHVISLNKFMEIIGKLMEMGGRLVIVTPNRESLVAKMLGKSWWHIRPPHLYYLSSENVVELAKQQNLKLLARSGFAWRHTIGYLLNCLQVFFFKRILINFAWLKVYSYLNTFDSVTLLFQKK